MLEETGLPYEPHAIRFDANEQTTPEFLSLSPNNKIPAILDPNGPGGKPLGLFESGAILIYLADKSGQLLPDDPARRYETIQWLMGDTYTIADIATFPWVNNLVTFYEAGELVGFADFPNVGRVVKAFMARPAVVRGRNIPERPKPA